MVVTPAELLSAKYAESSATVQVTGSGVGTIIDKFTVTNVTGVLVNFTAYLTIPLGVPSAANTVISSHPIASNETYTCPELVGHLLANGSRIATLASAGSSLIIRASGRILTNS